MGDCGYCSGYRTIEEGTDGACCGGPCHVCCPKERRQYESECAARYDGCPHGNKRKEEV